MLDTANHKAGVAVRTQDFLHGATDHGRVHHREITDADLRTFNWRLYLRLPPAAQRGEEDQYADDAHRVSDRVGDHRLVGSRANLLGGKPGSTPALA